MKARGAIAQRSRENGFIKFFERHPVFVNSASVPDAVGRFYSLRNVDRWEARKIRFRFLASDFGVVVTHSGLHGRNGCFGLE